MDMEAIIELAPETDWQPGQKTEYDRDALLNLAPVIVRQACIDYKASIVGLYFEKDPENKIKLLREKTDCEHFFQSSWYQMLTDIDGNKVMERIREIARETIRKRIDKQREKILKEMRRSR